MRGRNVSLAELKDTFRRVFEQITIVADFV